MPDIRARAPAEVPYSIDNVLLPACYNDLSKKFLQYHYALNDKPCWILISSCNLSDISNFVKSAKPDEFSFFAFTSIVPRCKALLSQTAVLYTDENIPSSIIPEKVYHIDLSYFKTKSRCITDDTLHAIYRKWPEIFSSQSCQQPSAPGQKQQSHLKQSQISEAKPLIDSGLLLARTGE